MRAGMRKAGTIVTCAAVAAMSVGGGALGEATTISRSASIAGATWSSTKQLRSGAYRITSWSIWVYRGTDLVEGLLYQDVVRCKKLPKVEPIPYRGQHPLPRKPRRGCVLESSKSGQGDITGSKLKFDEASLSEAHLNTMFALVSYDKKGKPGGPGVPTHVVADWFGHGEIAFSDGTFDYAKGDCKRSETYEDAYRDANAQATVAETALGSTPNGFLGTTSGTSTEEGCQDESPPVPVPPLPVG